MHDDIGFDRRRVHAPGPWILKFEPGMKLGGYRAASIITGWPRDPDMLSVVAIVSEADAKLIVAAPDMLAALERSKEKLKELRSAIENVRLPPPPASLNETLNVIRAAIARAIGD